jgi:hypothetical protein
MIANPHRTNSDFQLRHFLAGTCYTADGAWLLLYNQKMDIEEKLVHTQAEEIRCNVSKIRANHIINHSADYCDRELARATLLDISASETNWRLNKKAAENELATIIKLMAELEPMRKYGHLDVLEASEASQRQEWLGELKARAENYLITTGTLPHDQLAAMRSHPDFVQEIVPHIKKHVALLKGDYSALSSLDAALLTDGTSDINGQYLLGIEN